MGFSSTCCWPAGAGTGTLGGTGEMWLGGGFDFCVTRSWPRWVVYSGALTPFVSLADAGRRGHLPTHSQPRPERDTDGRGYSGNMVCFYGDWASWFWWRIAHQALGVG